DPQGVEQYREKKTVEVGPDGKVLAFAVRPPENLPKMWFLKLELADSSGEVVSDNLYWLSAERDAPGKSRYTPERVFYTEPESRADFTLLNDLGRATCETEVASSVEDEEQVLRVRVVNTSSAIAF